MGRSDNVIFWDFEGTLAYRRGGWRSALIEVLDINEPGHQIDTEQVRPYLRDGFPWHRPDESHTHITTSVDWWLQIEDIFARAYLGVGLNRNRAGELSSLVRDVYINPERFLLYEDTVPALIQLAEKGWKHAILSNHVPELPGIVDGTGLSPYTDYCITSGITGYEKPNPLSFKHALELTGYPGHVWMVGDNLEADIHGAESAGIPAILVRTRSDEVVAHSAHDLREVISIIESADNTLHK